MSEPTDNLVLSLLRELRKEQTDQRSLLLNLAESVRRIDARLDKRMLGVEARVGDLRDDLELMLKTELMGSRAHFETVYEQKLEALAERLATLEAR